MHNLLGPDWLFWGAMAVVMATPFVAAILVVIGIYYAWRAVKKCRPTVKRKAMK